MTMAEETSHRIQETVSRCWCSKKKRQFGIVLISNEPHHWEVKHSYSVNESYTEVESGRQTIKGAMELADLYNGCKWCSNKDIVLCTECQTLNCQVAMKRNTFQCANCGSKLQLAGKVTSLSVRRD